MPVAYVSHLCSSPLFVTPPVCWPTVSWRFATSWAQRTMLGMSEGRGNPEGTRRSMLAGLMMALLAGAVGIAWWLSESRHFDPQAASEILAGIRQRGLPALWGDKPVENWYMLRRTDGKPVGWSVSRRIRSQGGGYAGTRIGRFGGLFSEQAWTIDDAARKGQYVSRQWQWQPVVQPGQNAARRLALPSTKITLQNGEVTVVRADSFRAVKAVAPAPQDYIPEGLTDMVMYECAVQGRKAIFRILADDQAIISGQVAFAEIRVTPEGGRVVRREFDDSQEIMVFEETGGLLKVTYPQSGVWEEASSAEDVVRIFPDAKPYQKMTATAPATNPDLPSDESEPRELPDAAPDANNQNANGQDKF